MSIEENKAIMLRVIEEIWNQGKVELFDELFAADFVNHAPVEGVTGTIEGVKQLAVVMRQAFPDLHTKIVHMLAEGDRVGAYMFMEGTHSAPFMGVPATGRKVSAAMYSSIRVADGKIVERWGVSDGLGMFEQLGGTLVVPEQVS